MNAYTGVICQLRLIEAKVFSPEDRMIVNGELNNMQISLSVYGASFRRP